MSEYRHVPKNTKSEWVSAEELAQRWSVTAKTINNWRKRGVISRFAISLPGKGWRYDATAVEEYLRTSDVSVGGES